MLLVLGLILGLIVGYSYGSWSAVRKQTTRLVDAMAARLSAMDSSHDPNIPIEYVYGYSKCCESILQMLGVRK